MGDCSVSRCVRLPTSARSSPVSQQWCLIVHHLFLVGPTRYKLWTARWWVCLPTRFQLRPTVAQVGPRQPTSWSESWIGLPTNWVSILLRCGATTLSLGMLFLTRL